MEGGAGGWVVELSRGVVVIAVEREGKSNGDGVWNSGVFSERGEVLSGVVHEVGQAGEVAGEMVGA